MFEKNENNANSTQNVKNVSSEEIAKPLGAWASRPQALEKSGLEAHVPGKTGDFAISSSFDLSGRHILLVDDVQTNRMIVKVLLAKTNVVVDEADSGKAALDIFTKSPEGYYDAVFMDIQMPDMDGFETTRRLRKLPRTDALKTPIIAMTADAYEDMEESHRAEMNGYLSKPIDIEEMKKVIATVIAPR